jgi:hypothetical protein
MGIDPAAVGVVIDPVDVVVVIGSVAVAVVIGALLEVVDPIATREGLLERAHRSPETNRLLLDHFRAG